MADIIMAAGKEGRRYSQRGASAAREVNGRHHRLIRVDGEAYTFAQIAAQLPWPEEKLLMHIRKYQKRGDALTWELLRNLNIKDKRGRPISV